MFKDVYGATEIDDTACVSPVALTITSPGTGAASYVSMVTRTVDATETNVDDFLVPSRALRPTGLAVRVATAPDNGAATQSWNVRLRLDAADTTLNCTISEAAVGCVNTDPGHNLLTASTAATAHKLNLVITPTGTPTASGEMLITFCLNPD